MKKKTISLKLNTDLGGKKKGDVVSVQVDRDGVIIDSYWRRRLKDSAIDSCVEIVKPEKKDKGDKS